MPSVTFINETQVPLHVCLKHISPLHYATIQPNGGKQTLTKVGSVWFTIQAKIDRGDNAYSNWDTYVPIVAVSVGALSLGYGAIYVYGASVAAGSTSAAVATISSRIGAQMALRAQTVRKLYSYAQKGQKIVQIGQVIGIGGGAVAGKVLGDKEKRIEGKQPEKNEDEKKSGGYLSSLTGWRDDRKATKQAKKVLKGLLEGSVISSHGWFMNNDRVIKIVGGPKASELEGVLVIDTDNVQPFELVDASTGKKTKSAKDSSPKSSSEKVEGIEKTTLFDQELENGKAKEGQEKPDDAYLNSIKAEKEKEREMELKNQAGDLSLEFSEDEEEPPTGKDKSLGQTLYDSWELSRDYSLKKGSEILGRFKKEDGTSGVVKKDDTDDEGDKVAPSDSIHASKDPFVNDQSQIPDSTTNKGDETPLKILLEMGFDLEESEKALKESKGDTEMAIELLFNDPKNSNVDQIVQQSEREDAEKVPQAAVSTSDFKPETTSTPTPNDQVQPQASSSDPDQKKPLKVVGGEELEKPHWTKPLTDLDQKVGASSKIMKYGGDAAKEWLGKGTGAPKK